MTNRIYWEVKIAHGQRWKAEHRHVMEQLLGRALLASEDVHHRDENGLNNHPDNLLVIDHGAHRLEHGLKGRWATKHECCQTCGTTERKHMSKGNCTACHQRLRYQSSK